MMKSMGTIACAKMALLGPTVKVSIFNINRLRTLAMRLLSTPKVAHMKRFQPNSFCDGRLSTVFFLSENRTLTCVKVSVVAML